MNIRSSVQPQRPVRNLTDAFRYWRAQGERVRHKLDLLGERAELETNVYLKSIEKL